MNARTHRSTENARRQARAPLVVALAIVDLVAVFYALAAILEFVR